MPLSTLLVRSLLCVSLGAFANGALAQTPSAADKKKQAAMEDIMDHRTMAEAHARAAQCLEAGRSEKECHDQLAKDCKGVGIGKTCGMKHRHKH